MPWKKGQTGNPGGRPKMDPSVREAIGRNGQIAVERMHQLLNDETAWGPDGFPVASAGLRMRARDLAKIASVVLHDGSLQGRQIVPEAWIAASTTRHVQDTPWGPPGAYGYGYFWFPGTLLSGHRVILASGWGDQRIYVLPDLGLAIAIFAGNHDRGSRGIGERITGRIVRALR